MTGFPGTETGKPDIVTGKTWHCERKAQAAPGKPDTETGKPDCGRESLALRQDKPELCRICEGLSALWQGRRQPKIAGIGN